MSAYDNDNMTLKEFLTDNSDFKEVVRKYQSELKNIDFSWAGDDTEKRETLIKEHMEQFDLDLNNDLDEVAWSFIRYDNGVCDMVSEIVRDIIVDELPGALLNRLDDNKKAHTLIMTFFDQNGTPIKDADLGQVEFEVPTIDDLDSGNTVWKRLDKLTSLELELLTEKLNKYDDCFKLALIQAWEYAT